MVACAGVCLGGRPGAPDHGGLDVSVSGLALVGADAIQVRAQNEAQALAFDVALNLAFENRGHMGYPWIDVAAKTLEVSAGTIRVTG